MRKSGSDIRLPAAVQITRGDEAGLRALVDAFERGDPVGAVPAR